MPKGVVQIPGHALDLRRRDRRRGLWRPDGPRGAVLNQIQPSEHEARLGIVLRREGEFAGGRCCAEPQAFGRQGMEVPSRLDQEGMPGLDFLVVVFQNDPKALLFGRKAFQHEFVEWHVLAGRSDLDEVLVARLGEECFGGIRGRMQHQAVGLVEKAVLPDTHGLAVEPGFQLSPAAKPEIRTEVEEAAKGRIGVDPVCEPGALLVAALYVKRASRIALGNSTFVAVLLPVKQRRVAHRGAVQLRRCGRDGLRLFRPNILLCPVNLKHD